VDEPLQIMVGNCPCIVVPEAVRYRYLALLHTTNKDIIFSHHVSNQSHYDYLTFHVIRIESGGQGFDGGTNGLQSIWAPTHLSTKLLPRSNIDGCCTIDDFRNRTTRVPSVKRLRLVLHLSVRNHCILSGELYFSESSGQILSRRSCRRFPEHVLQ
jgi:hypothetical protein